MQMMNSHLPSYGAYVQPEVYDWQTQRELLDHMETVRLRGLTEKASRIATSRDIAGRLGFSIKRIFDRRYMASAAYVS